MQPQSQPRTLLLPPHQTTTQVHTPRSNTKQTYRIQLRTIDTTKPTDKTKIFETTFRDLNAPLIRLTPTRTGYYAVTDDVTSIDKLTSTKATALFNKLNLTPIIPPDLRAKRTVFVRQIDSDIGTRPSDEIKDELKRQNDWMTVTDIIKIKNYTHLLKIVTNDTTTAQRVLRDGFYMFHTKITPQQCEQEHYTHILICYKCYKFEDHPTHKCTTQTQHCSECASQDHTYQQCTSTLKQCLNCHGPHRTLAANCTYRKDIIKHKQENEHQQQQQQTHNTYAEIAKHAIQQTNPPKHTLTLTNQTHIKLTALILEAHIAALDKTQKFGDILSHSLKTNFNIDTTFPDRDSAAIFNFYYDKTEQHPQHTTETPADAHHLHNLTTDTQPENTDMITDTDTRQKRRISDETENSFVLLDNKHTLPIKLFRSVNDDSEIPNDPSPDWFIKELSKDNDRGLKFTVQDLKSHTLLDYIKTKRAIFTRTQLNVIAHNQFISLPRHQTQHTTSKKTKSQTSHQ
jgi:hypothetical protein